MILAVHFAITTLEHLIIHCSYSLATRYFTAWPINLSKLGYMNTIDIVKCLIYPSRSLKIPDKERQIFTLFASLLIDNIYRVQNQNFFFQVPLQTLIIQLRQSINPTYYEHFAAWFAMKFTLASSWIPPPLGWMKTNFDIAIRLGFSIAAAVFA